MKRFLSLSLAILCALCFGSAPASAQTAPHSTVSTISAAKSGVPVSSPLAAKFTLAMAAAGATGAAAGGSRRMNLSQSYLFNGETFGPGNDIEVPEDFPDIDGETGAVIHPAGSIAERNLLASARAGGAPIAGRGMGAGTGSADLPTTVGGLSSAELEELSKAELVALAEKVGVVVEREDGDGEPLKADYVRVLGASSRGDLA